MSVVELLATFSKLGIELAVDGEDLRCRAPKGVLTPQLRSQLAAHKTDILAFMGNQAAGGVRRVITPVARDRNLPLSFAQQRLWIVDQLSPGDPVYNIAFAVSLSGPLDVASLEASFNEIIRRHESLRTTFDTASGEPVQVIAPSLLISLPVIDLTSLGPDEREETLRQLALAEAQRPFDLRRGPLVRFTLVRLGNEEHVALWTAHHIVADGWSLGVLLGELGQLYPAFSRGLISPLKELTIQYADYAVWQREWQQGAALDRSLAYWREQLKDAPPVLTLPTFCQRPSVQSFRGARHHLFISKSVYEGLNAISRQSLATMYMTLLAAFNVLLYRYTGADDLPVGTIIANRQQPEVEGLIGFFANTLVLRNDLSGDPDFVTLLGRIKQVCLEAYAHQEVPFELLVEKLQPQRDLRYNPLFQVAFTFLDDKLPAASFLSEVSIKRLEFDPQVSHFDLTLDLLRGRESVSGYLEYNTDLFDKSAIARLANNFQNLLEAIVRNPHEHISGLPILSAAERHQTLIEWNATRTNYQGQWCVHQLFEEQAQQTPEATAVVFDDERLSYRQLNERANQLAHHLRKLGVGPEVRVGICAERSVEMIIGLLGILKAGGVYVPLDPEYPRDRLTFMMADAEIFVLLTQQHLADLLPPHHLPVFLLDVDWPSLADESIDCLVNGATPDNLAYVIYTSGSTGGPKGVEISHRAIVRLVNHTDYVQLTPADRVAQLSNSSFDAATFEIWGALLNGATLVGMIKDVALTPRKFADQIKDREITTIFLTTALFNLLAREVPGVFQPLRHLLFGGEIVEPGWVREVLEKGAPERLLHVYGPTESTTFTTWQQVEVVQDTGTIPIGRPIANTEVYILDPEMQPVPVGVAGELYIGGDGLARGYLKHPMLTAARFVPHPFSAEPGGRLYRTGDVGRYKPDGAIEFLGRTDQQVKIRGFRVELGEIEALLLQLPPVSQAVAILREDVPGDKRLAAYVVAKAGCQLTVTELRADLKEKLPAYMVPSAFIMLDALPLTPNGKVDHRVLPPPDQTRAGAEEQYVAPRTPLEQSLARIWGEVLNVEQVGVHDNFFDLGGHSLLATQVISRVRETLQLEVVLRDLFAAPTIAAFAQTLLNAPRIGADAIVAMQRTAPETQVPMSFAQQRLWFLEQFEGGNSLYNIAAAVKLNGTLDIAALSQSFNEIVRRHESFRTSFAMKDGQPLQVIVNSLTLPVPLVDLSKLPVGQHEAEVMRLVKEESLRPFILSQNPLLRVKVFRLHESEHILTVTMHHIISDGWSMGVLIRELAVLYNAFSTGQTSQLPELPFQYADYSVWQREWLKGNVLEEQLAYWRDQLRGSPPLLEVPADRPRPVVRSYRGAHVNLELPQTLIEQLKELSQRHNVTLFITVLAAFKALLHRYTGVDDLLIGSPIANRTRSEFEGLIGFFVNMLVLRTDLSGNPTFAELLNQVKQVCLDAYAHQDLPFEQLVDELQPERDLGLSPLFQVAFVMQNLPLKSLELRGLTLTPLDLQREMSKWDLMLTLVEEPAGWRAEFEYSTALFDAATIWRMAGHFKTLLEGIVAKPEQHLAQLPLLSEDEHRQQLSNWNDTRREYPRASAINRLFEEQVRRTPEAVALISQTGSLSYATLNARANQLAHYLRSLGVAPEVNVAIAIERSEAMVIGLLAILKAGAGYLPLDVNYPVERLAFMLEDANVSVVLTEQRYLDSLPAGAAAIVICLDTDQELITEQSEDDLAGEIDGENVAYVIYTSGSTGSPKGVAIPHQAVNGLVLNTDYVQLSPADRVAQISNSSFDAAAFEIWGALLNGASLVIIPKDIILSPLEFAAELQAREISVLFLTTALFNQLAGAVPRTFRTLRDLLMGGETIDPESVRQVLYHGPPERFLHMYGPTETSTFATWHLIQSVSEEATSIPIGWPRANTQVYLLDQRLQLAPVGAPAEIFIGGDGLARGYLNQPALTAERFIPHPFSDSPGARLYRSGDLARYLPDGRIEFLGRLDQQVKLRGFRIEPAEIEIALTQHEAVREAVVVLREDAPGEKRLVAYVVLKEQQEAAAAEPADSVAELRNYLRQRLPDYMVPAALVLLEALPLTPNGKVDRRALPAMAPRYQEQQSYAPPQTELETALTGIWADVLAVERVGIHDNFFDLGGDSIRSIQLCARAQSRGINFSIQQLFQYPTIHTLAQNLSVEQSSLQRMEKTEPFSLISDEDRQKLPPDIDDAYPLAALQSGMLFHAEYNPDVPLYHEIFNLHLQAPLEPSALQSAIQQLVNRHPSLRTSFDLTQYSEPLQLVHTAVALPFSVIDLSHLSPSEQASELEAAMEIEKRRHFDWSHPPLIRVVVYRCGEDRFWINFSWHHAIIDGWSAASFITDLFQQYFTLLGLENYPPLAPLMVTYADYVALERKAVQSEECREFFTEKLSESSVTALPRQAALPAAPSGPRIRVLEVPLSTAVSDGLKRISRSESIQLKSILLAVHLRVLSLLTGQLDVTTGLATNGRLDDADGDKVFGLHLNTLPFRLKLSDVTWLELAREVFRAEQELLPFRRYPLVQLQRDLNRQPLFETLFNFTHFHVYRSAAGFKDMRFLEMRFFAETNFAFMTLFNLNPITSDLQFELDYDTTQFSEQQVEAIKGYYIAALTAVANEPERRYSSCSLLSPAERTQLLSDWNNTRREYPRESTVHQLFEAQAARSPESIALVSQTGSRTYGELNARSNQLAHYLRQLGVRPEDRVAIAVERSEAMVIALLGILKAGAGYLPLDLAYPEERLAFMLHDAQVSLVLTEDRFLERLSDTQVRVVNLDAARESIARESEENPTIEVGAENIAYVIYTSGSTGAPKGVVVCHRGVVRLVCGVDYLQFNESRTFLQQSPTSFDASTFELWGALLHGARCVLFPTQLSTIGEQADLINTHDVDTLWLTASLFNAVIDEAPAALAGIRQLLVGGEALSVDHIKRALEHLPETEIINGYGPTENTTFTCCYSIPRALLDEDPTSIPIGWPLANSHVYLLDQQLQLAPVGAPAELFIGGDGLARGYLNQPALTAERFIPHPFSDSPGARLYRSGDLARYLPDGRIEFLGRLDQQVKLRGFRIEPAEIEIALTQHEAVREAVVVLREDAPGEKRLVAYVVLKEPQEAAAAEPADSVAELRNYLRQRLPDYMVPAALVLLEALPLTPNGKVDRRALPVLTPRDQERSYEPPRTELETALAGIWVDVLAVERVGIHDNFFDLGGDSLSATRLITRVSDLFQTKLPVKALFEAATIAELSRALIAAEVVPGRTETIARLFGQVEAMSANEVILTVENERRARGQV